MGTSTRKWLDRRLIYLVLIAISLFAAFYPQNIPVKISEATQKAYDAIEAVPDGSYILMYSGGGSLKYMGSQHIAIAVNTQVQRKNLKVILISYMPINLPWIILGMEDMYAQPLNTDPLYGTEIVFLGAPPGGELAIITLSEDIRSLMPVDYYGNSLDSLPMMVGFNALKDVKLCIAQWFGAQTSTPVHTYLTGKFNIPMICYADNQEYASNLTMYKAGVYVGMMHGSRGGLEYETAVGIVGLASLNQWVYTLGASVVIILMVAVNIEAVYRKLSGGGT